MVWNYYFISARWLPPLRINKVKVKSKSNFTEGNKKYYKEMIKNDNITAFLRKRCCHGNGGNGLNPENET